MNEELGGRPSGQAPDESGVSAPNNVRIPAGESLSTEEGLSVNQAEYGSPGGAQPGHDFLELVYGVLFDPVKTMARVAQRPPVGIAFLVVTIAGILGLASGYLAASEVLASSLPGDGLEQLLAASRALLPFWAVFGLFWGYLKWFGFSAVVHLAAGLLGGNGTAGGVFAAVGLANMPSILLIPVNLMILWLGAGRFVATFLVGLTGLTAVVWTAILLVIGLRQVHGLSNGWSVLVVVSPFLTLAVLVIFMFMALVGVIASQPERIYPPGFF